VNSYPPITDPVPTAAALLRAAAAPGVAARSRLYGQGRVLGRIARGAGRCGDQAGQAGRPARQTPPANGPASPPLNNNGGDSLPPDTPAFGRSRGLCHIHLIFTGLPAGLHIGRVA